MMHRRQFLSLAVAGVMLGVGSAYYVLPDEPMATHTVDYLWLTDDEAQLLTAFLPIFLHSYPRNTSDRVILSMIDQAIYGQFSRVQKELRQLFTILQNKVLRLFVAQQWASFSNASFAQKEALLRQWRDASVDVLQTAYTGLHDLVLGAYFAHSQNWQNCRYPGPPVVR